MQAQLRSREHHRQLHPAEPRPQATLHGVSASALWRPALHVSACKSILPRNKWRPDRFAVSKLTSPS